MANKLSTLRQAPAENPSTLIYKDTITGNYTAGGDACDLTPTNVSDTMGLGVIGPNVLPTIPPKLNVANAQGYRGEWIPGTTLANGAIKWYAPGGAELAAGAYPAAITGAVVLLEIFHQS